MTALHHYWLRPGVTSAVPLWAWPCTPTRLGTQGLSLSGPYIFGPRVIGGHLGGIYSGSSTGDPCDHTYVATIDASNTNPLVQVDALPLATTWTMECRFGWSSSLVPTSIDVIRLVGGADPRARYTPGSGTLDLFIAGASVASTSASLASDTFHHVALTHSSGEYQLWLNGALVLSYTGAAKAGSSNLTMGTVFGSRHPTFFGGARLWDVVAYTAAFTPPTSLTVP